MSLNLKLAAQEDRQEFLRMSQAFYESSPFAGVIRFSPPKLYSLFDLSLSSSHGQVLVLLLRDKDQVVGMIVGYATETPFSDVKVASELAWWIDPPYRGRREAMELVHAYEAWARKVGCSSVSMSLLPALTDVSKIYERMGYVKTEISYLKGL